MRRLTQASIGRRRRPEQTYLRFWGVRGSIAAPGSETIFYGGNTSCVEVRFNGQILVLDAGTGLRRLGLALMEEFKGSPIHLSLLISHTHWDHIQGFPFFLPAYDPKNKLTVFGFEGARKGLQRTLSSQMESPYFPISLQQMPGHISFKAMKEEFFKIGTIKIHTHLLHHPGSCTGYRIFTPGGSISYLPDVELGVSAKADHALLEFIRGSTVLILDSQYDAAEYKRHIGWGHSCMDESVSVAMAAGVESLYLFHHDPDHTDGQISRMLARARGLAGLKQSSLVIEAAREGAEIIF